MGDAGRGWNFSAGPAGIPLPVLERAREEFLDWNGNGASVMELSHRGAAFMAMAARAEADLRALLDVPGNYRVLFLQGGATQHFAQIPMNLATADSSADYLITGHWGEKACKEAAAYVSTRIVANNLDDGGIDIPARSTWQLDPDAAYLHYTPNETIHGVEFHDTPAVGEVPLVADMSSDILSRPVDVSKFGLIYAGAQKNIGASGLVVMIIRDDLLRRTARPMARIFAYAEHAAAGSMLNTPNTFGWYLAGLTFQWLLAEGGLAAIGECNAAKAGLLYACIDESDKFYRNPVARGARSRMNVPFMLHDASLDALFLEQSQAAGLIGLKGHRALGGMRASLYNAMPMEGVQALVDFMQDFRRRHA